MRHPFLVGELACGRLGKRAEILALLNALPCAAVVEHEEALEFVARSNLVGSGLGRVDVDRGNRVADASWHRR